MGCGSSISIAGNKTVVVVGNGLAGASLAGMLDPHCRVISIEKRGAHIHKYGSVRAVVDTSYSNIIPLDKYLARGDQRIGVVVTEVQQSHIVLSDGTTVPYDVLVLAVGARAVGVSEPAVNSPESTGQEIKQWFAKVATAIKSADSIAIIGGGPIGVETSGEIRDLYPDKQLTILHSRDTLCNNGGTAALSAKLVNACKAKNIDIKFNVRANLEGILDLGKESFYEGKTDIPLSDGSSFPCDLVLPCVGIVPNGKNIANVPVDEKGFIKVNKFLQVDGYENVFAVGDCNNCGDAKLGLFAGAKNGPGMPIGQVDIAVKNIQALSEGKPLTPRVIVPPKLMIVPVGMGAGAVQGVPGLFQKMMLKMKSKDYFLGKTVEAMKTTTL